MFWANRPELTALAKGKTSAIFSFPSDEKDGFPEREVNGRMLGGLYCSANVVCPVLSPDQNDRFLPKNWELVFLQSTIVLAKMSCSWKVLKLSRSLRKNLSGLR